MRWGLVNVAAIALTLACADSATAPMVDRGYPAVASVGEQGSARTDIEMSFLDIDSRSPGFAGFYFEGEGLVTMSASPTSDVSV